MLCILNDEMIRNVILLYIGDEYSTLKPLIILK